MDDTKNGQSKTCFINDSKGVVARPTRDAIRERCVSHESSHPPTLYSRCSRPSPCDVCCVPDSVKQFAGS